MALRLLLLATVLAQTLLLEAIFDDDFKELVTCVKSNPHIADEGETLTEQNRTDQAVECDTNYCFAYWHEDPVNGSVTIMGQGKW